MNVLCTGGAGYVGSAAVRWLLRHGHHAAAYDDLSTGNAKSVPSNLLIKGDILDTDLLVQTMKERKTECVMHFAAVASVPDSIADPDSYWNVNLIGTKSVLDAMRRAGVWRIILSSTAATYGFDNEMPLVETSDQIPEVPYGTTKLACETIIREYANAYDIGYTFLRYFNASGADIKGDYGEDRPVESHLIPLCLHTAIGKREKLFVYGGEFETRDGSCVRDYVHTSDLAQAHQLAMEALEPGKGAAYNLGSGDGTTVLEVLKACEEAVGREIPHEIVDARPGDPGILVASPEAIKNALGWNPEYSDIKTIVDSAWRWHDSHPNGYGDR